MKLLLHVIVKFRLKVLISTFDIQLNGYQKISIYRVGHELLTDSSRFSFEEKSIKCNPVKKFEMRRQILL